VRKNVKNREEVRKSGERLRKIRTFRVKMSKNVFVLRMSGKIKQQKAKSKITCCLDLR